MSNATAVSVIAAMITPALLILASASLAASALARMARIVDRARALAAGVHDRSWDKMAATPEMFRGWLERHEARARYAESSIALLYAAIVVFTATCLSIALDRATGGALAWLPVWLAIGGTVLLLGGGVWMVAESRLSWDQIREEIDHARRRLGGRRPMSYTPLDPKTAVILFADLQAGIIELTATNELARLRRAVAALAKLAAIFDIPAIVTTGPAEGGPQVAPEIAASLGELPLHTRTTTDAFTHPPTHEAIAKTGRKTLLIAGVATEIIVQHSALSGAAHGFDVQVVIDACGGVSLRTEDAALRRLVQAGVVTTSIASVAGQLAADFTQPRGARALGVVYEMASG